MKKLFLGICAIGLLLSFTVGMSMAITDAEIFRASKLNQILQRKQLVVGMEIGYYPFEYVDSKGNFVGFDVELAKLIADYLGVDIAIKDVEWSNLIPALNAGKIDVIISGMARTLERAKTVSFTDTYFETGLCTLLSKARAGGIRSVKSLNETGRTIAVVKNTTGDFAAGKLFPNAEVKQFQSESACVEQVATGKMDAFIYDQITIWKRQKENPDTTCAILKPMSHEFFSIATVKGDGDFLNWLNQFLHTIRSNGLYEQLDKKYLSQFRGVEIPGPVLEKVKSVPQASEVKPSEPKVVPVSPKPTKKETRKKVQRETAQHYDPIWDITYDPPKKFRAIRGVTYRKGPGSSYKAEGVIRKGEIVTVTEMKKGWYALDMGLSSTVYVWKDFFVPVR